MLISLDQSNPPEEPLSGPSSKKLKSQGSQRKRKYRHKVKCNICGTIVKSDHFNKHNDNKQWTWFIKRSGRGNTNYNSIYGTNVAYLYISVLSISFF